MAVATLTPYDKFVQGQISGSHFVDLDGDIIKLALLAPSYTPDKANHEFYSDLTGELSGGGYPSGGIALTGKTLTLTTGTPDVVIWDADNVTFGTISGTFRYGGVYKDTASRPLIGWVDFLSNQTPAGIDYIVQWSANGLLVWRVLP